MAYGPFNTGFRGTANGAIQTVVTDQLGAGVTGQLLFASDDNNVNSLLVTGTNGVFAGAGVQVVDNAGAATSFQLPGSLVQVPDDAALTIADFGGIVVFDENMQSDAAGNAGWDAARVARILSPKRAGGRLWIKANAADTWTKGTSTLNWVVKAGTDGKYAGGEFAPTALAGSAAAGYSVAITGAAVLTTTTGGIVAIELKSDNTFA